jgi:hypothetical protein
MRLSDKDAGKRIKEFVQSSLDIAHGEGRETQADVDAVYALEAQAEAKASSDPSLCPLDDETGTCPCDRGDFSVCPDKQGDDTCKTQPGSGFAHMVGAFGDHEPRVGYHRLFGNH